MTRSSVLTRQATARPYVSADVHTTRRTRSAVTHLDTRPDAGTVEYGFRGPGVSRTPHVQKKSFGFVQGCAVALATAVLSLGLVGLANLRAVDTAPAPSPAAVSSVEGAVDYAQ